MKRLGLIIVTCCTVFLLGCEDKSEQTHGIPWERDIVTSIYVRVSTNELTAPAGVVRAVGVTAIAVNAAGVGKPDVELSLSV
ncbi:MAG: hypothetical protein HN356_11305, partial [Calditrichaeota bacterium]|nr:hypothetical protein [Calditrichota bacterium]